MILLPQALPGSRLDTIFLQTWLLENLTLLSSQQAAITASEAKKQQAAQAAAASAAVRAVQVTLEGTLETGLDRDSSLSSALQQSEAVDKLWLSSRDGLTEQVMQSGEAQNTSAQGLVEAARAESAGLHQSAPATLSWSLPDAIMQAAASATVTGPEADPNRNHSTAAVHALACSTDSNTDGAVLHMLQLESSAGKAQPLNECSGVTTAVAEMAKELQGGHVSQQIMAMKLLLMSACFGEVCQEVQLSRCNCQQDCPHSIVTVTVHVVIAAVL